MKLFMLDSRKNWSRAILNWGDYVSPFRPSKNDIQKYKLAIGYIKSKRRILLLGSTPEIRKILAKLGLSIVVADFSQEMLKGMQKFCKKMDFSNESLLKSDWLELHYVFENNYFDLILGDLVLRNIEPALQKKFFKIISNLLKKDGYFISRIHCINEGTLRLNTNKIIKSVFKNHSKLGYRHLEDLITSRLFDKCTDFKKHVINKNKFKNEIKKYLKKPDLSKKEKLILKNILEKWTAPSRRLDRTWTQRNAKEINNLFAKNFIKINIKKALDYIDCKYYPLYILKNKK